VRQEIAKAQALVARIAARQHGVISQGQLVTAGMSPSTITRRVREGWLHRVHRGVYAVGHRNLNREGQWIAAVLACGQQAVLSHESAAALWSISPTCPPLVHVSVPGTNGRRPSKGIVVHRSTTLIAAETTRRRGIPVTTHARTLRDLGFGPEPTRSTLERAFLRLCGERGIPLPQVNAQIGPYTVDFL
jgi:predicted transcriptional regulator of viral defense system